MEWQPRCQARPSRSCTKSSLPSRQREDTILVLLVQRRSSAQRMVYHSGSHRPTDGSHGPGRASTSLAHQNRIGMITCSCASSAAANFWRAARQRDQQGVELLRSFQKHLGGRRWPSSCSNRAAAAGLQPGVGPMSSRDRLIALRIR